VTWNKLAKVVPSFEEFWRPGSQLVHEQGLKILVWGEPEVGKTHFALTAPEPVYVVDTEYGVAPVLRHFKHKRIFVYEAAVV